MRWITTAGITTIVALTGLASGCGTADQINNAGGSSSTGPGGGGATGAAGGGGNTGGDSGNTGGKGGSGGGSGNTGGNGGSAGSSSNTGGSGGSGGNATGGGSGNTGGSGGSGPCMPITQDPSKIGALCGNGVGCPTGYTCQPFNGITVTYSCAILCDEDCECPADTVCIPKRDKVASWMECSKP
jgi:hypothetical protein